MKTLMTNPASVLVKTAMIIAAVLFLSGRSYSQISVDDITATVKVELKQNAIENLKLQISSENPGVRKSAVYFAGYYKVKETLSPLMEQMEVEKDPSVRILIALSLYKLNSDSAFEMVKMRADTDQDLRVRRMCSAIAKEYRINKGSVAAK